MLRFSDKQIESFRPQALAQFVERSLVHVRDYFPMQWRTLTPAVLEPGIYETIRILEKEHSIRSQRDILLWLSLAMMTGTRFDLDPMTPWAGRVLSRGPEKDPALDTRMREVADLALKHQKRVAGEKNARIIKALLALHKDNARVVDPEFGGEPGVEVPARIAAVFPHKVNAIGQDRFDALVTYSSAVADVHGFTSPEGQTLWGVLHFMLGAGAHEDPFLGWFSGALADTVGRPEPQRIAKLHAKAVEMLDRIVEASKEIGGV